MTLLAGGEFGGVWDCSSAVVWGTTAKVRFNPIAASGPLGGGELGGVNEFSWFGDWGSTLGEPQASVVLEVKKVSYIFGPRQGPDTHTPVDLVCLRMLFSSWKSDSLLLQVAAW